MDLVFHFTEPLFEHLSDEIQVDADRGNQTENQFRSR
jgi:hypothetical protein